MFGGTPAAGCAEPEEAPTTIASIRSLVLGPDRQLVAGLARRFGDRQAGDSDRLASQGIDTLSGWPRRSGIVTVAA